MVAETAALLVLASSSAFAGSAPLLAYIAAASAGCTCVCVAGPRLLGSFLARVVRNAFKHEGLRTDIRRAAQDAEGPLVDILWSAPMRKGMQAALVDFVTCPEFHAAMVSVGCRLSKDSALQGAIKEGVLAALRDEVYWDEVKAVIVRSLRDSDLRDAVLKNLILTVKFGIREAMNDAELRDVMTEAVRDAVEDPRLREVLRTMLKDALADKDLHEATIKGAAEALNPFKDFVLPAREDIFTSIAGTPPTPEEAAAPEGPDTVTLPGIFGPAAPPFARPSAQTWGGSFSLLDRRPEESPQLSAPLTPPRTRKSPWPWQTRPTGATSRPGV